MSTILSPGVWKLEMANVRRPGIRNNWRVVLVDVIEGDRSTDNRVTARFSHGVHSELTECIMHDKLSG